MFEDPELQDPLSLGLPKNCNEQTLPRQEPRKAPASPRRNCDSPEIRVVIKEEEEGWTVSETYESFNPEGEKQDASADARHLEACGKESSVPHDVRKHRGRRSEQSGGFPPFRDSAAGGEERPGLAPASSDENSKLPCSGGRNVTVHRRNNVRKKRSPCLRHEAGYKSNMRSDQSTREEEEETRAQDQSTTSHPEAEARQNKRAAPCQKASPERKHTQARRLKAASTNLDDQTLHLTVRLRAGEEEEEDEDEEEEEEDEEIGGLINSDGEVVEWDATGGSPDRSSDCTEASQQSKGVILSESHLQHQDQRDSNSPTLIMEVEGEEGEEKEGAAKSTAVVPIYCGRRQRRTKKAPVVSVDSSDAQRDVPAKAAKRRCRGKISETPLLSGEDLDTEPGISRRTRRKTTLRATVAPEELAVKPVRHAAAKRHYRRRKDSTPLAKGKGESTGAAAGKKRPGRKMVRIPIEIPPELLKKPKEKIEYHCSVCGKEFPHAYKLERHELIHTGEKPYCCSICGRGFNQKGNLKTHYKVHLGRKGAVDFDDEVSPIASELSEYLKSLPGESRIRSSLRCLECGTECESQSVLQAHHAAAHAQTASEADAAEPAASELFFCRRCGVQFADREKLEEHMKSHVKEKPYSCPDCGKRFINESYIQIHQRIHTGEKPFLCSQCGRGFHTASSLKLHEMQHSGERPFACTICGKTFRINSYLTAHYQTHIKDRPFVCGVCGKGYSRAEELKVHHRLHTGERPYECGECGKSFIYRQGLRQHQRTHAGRRIGPTRQLGRPKQQARLDI